MPFFIGEARKAIDQSSCMMLDKRSRLVTLTSSSPVEGRRLALEPQRESRRVQRSPSNTVY
jgi:hypothetical protein